jgi:hypothetical protein
LQARQHHIPQAAFGDRIVHFATRAGFSLPIRDARFAAVACGSSAAPK